MADFKTFYIYQPKPNLHKMLFFYVPNSLFGGKKTKKNLRWFFIETKFALIYQIFRQ